MASIDSQTAGPSQAELDATMNRIQLKLAANEALVKSWTAKSKAVTYLPPRKTDAELDAEDALLFRPQPPYLGVGCPIPENFMISEADRSKKMLESKFGRGLLASKRRDAEEKAESAKRTLAEDSSDDEGGRSMVGKKKKVKISAEEPVSLVKETKTEAAKKVDLSVSAKEGIKPIVDVAEEIEPVKSGVEIEDDIAKKVERTEMDIPKKKKKKKKKTKPVTEPTTQPKDIKMDVQKEVETPFAAKEVKKTEVDFLKNMKTTTHEHSPPQLKDAMVGVSKKTSSTKDLASFKPAKEAKVDIAIYSNSEDKKTQKTDMGNQAVQASSPL
jgi:hypothetical protein